MSRGAERLGFALCHRLFNNCLFTSLNHIVTLTLTKSFYWSKLNLTPVVYYHNRNPSLTETSCHMQKLEKVRILKTRRH